MSRRSQWLLSALLSACGGGAAEAPGPVVVAVSAPTALGPGDVFEVRVFGELDLSGVYRLGSDGGIDFPLVGHLVLQDMAPTEAAQTVAGELKRFVKSPQV